MVRNQPTGTIELLQNAHGFRISRVSVAGVLRTTCHFPRFAEGTYNAIVLATCEPFHRTSDPHNLQRYGRVPLEKVLY